MNTVLVAGASLAGLVLGGALDPLAQREADLSRAEDERRRAEAAPTPTAGADGADEPRSALVHAERAATSMFRAADADDTDDPGALVGDLAVRQPVPLRTAAAAVVTGALFGGAAVRFGAHVVLAPFCVFFAMLVAVSSTDLTHRLVPRRLIYGALVLIVPLLVVTAAVESDFGPLAGSAVAGAAAFAVFFALWWFVPRGMGYGDVRLAGAIGLTVGYLSLLHAYVAFLAGFVIGMVFGLVLMVRAGTGRRTRIPFAPSLSAGAVIAVLWGGDLAHHLFHAGS